MLKMSVFISLLPEHLLLATFLKMKLLPLMRIRQTTTAMAAFVENNRHALKRNKDSVELYISIEDRQKLVYRCLFARDARSWLRTINAEKLSAVNVKRLEISKRSNDQEMDCLPEIINFLKELRISPKVGIFNGVCQIFMEAILDALPSLKKIEIGCGNKEINCREFAQHPSIKRALEVTANIDNYYREDEGYEEFGEYTAISVEWASVEAVMNFVRDIITSTFNRLRRAEFYFADEETAFETLTNDFPSITHFSDFLEDQGFYSRHVRHCAEESSIFLLDAGSKWIAITRQSQEAISLRWCDKNPKALLEAFEDLIFTNKRISSHPDFMKFVEEFSADDVQEQAEVFRRLCYQCYNEKSATSTV